MIEAIIEVLERAGWRLNKLGQPERANSLGYDSFSSALIADALRIVVLEAWRKREH